MASISKVGKKYKARVFFYDKNGERHAKGQTFDNENEAKRWATSMQKRVYDDQVTIDSSYPLPDYFWDWFETYKEPTVSERTKLTYKQVHNVLTQYFQYTAIESISRRDYQRFLTSYGKQHAKSTVSKYNALIHACIKDAIYDGVITKDFVSSTNIVYDAKKTKKIEYLNIDEMNQLANYLIDNLNPHFTSKYMILTAIYSGMRLGEIQGLTWNDINFKFKTISINRSWNENSREFQPTKNESSVRILRVNQELMDILHELKTAVNGTNKDQVFTNQFKTVPTSSAVNKALREFMQACNIERKGFHFHSLRHTHVAYLLANETDLYAISKRLGHSDIGTTSRVYSYLIDEYKVRTDNMIESVLDKITTTSDDEKENARM